MTTSNQDCPKKDYILYNLITTHGFFNGLHQCQFVQTVRSNQCNHCHILPSLNMQVDVIVMGSWLVDSHYYLENDSYSFSHNTQTSTQAPRTLSTSCVGTSLAQSRCFQYFFQSTTPKHKTTIQNMKLRLMRPCHSRLQLKTEKQWNKIRQSR